MSNLTTSSRKKTLGAVLVLTAATGYGCLGIFAKMTLLNGLNVESSIAWRFVGAFLVFFIWQVFVNRWKVQLHDFLMMFLLGAIGYSSHAGLYYHAISRIDVGLAAMLLFSYPSFIFILVWLIQRERPSILQLAALLLSFVGIALCIGIKSERFDYVGVIFALGCALSYALYIVITGIILKKRNAIVTAMYVSFGAASSFLLYALFAGSLVLPTNAQAVIGVVGTIVLGTLVPLTTLYAGIQFIGNNHAAVLSTFELVVTVVLGVIIFNESVTISRFLGAALIVFAILLPQLYPARYPNL